MRLFFIRIKQMVFKEFLQALRDPRMRALLIGPPIIQLIVFGYAANLDLKNISTALYDEDNTMISREVASAFSSSGYFKFVARVSNDKEVSELLNRGRVKAALHFGPGLAGRVKSGRTAQVQVIVAGTDSNTASVVQSYALQIIEGYNRAQLEKRLEQNPIMIKVLPAGVSGILQPRVRIWYNPELASVNFYVPGIIGLIIMLVTLILTSMAVVREKEIGTMEQIMVTPVRPFEFILGKTIPFSVIGFVQVALVTTIGVFWFNVPMRGNLLLLAVSLSIYLLSALGAGLLISTISRTQQQALFTTFFFFFPTILLSGFIFPIANMPWIIQVIT
ncbi:MAG: ABC transporter permease, partial [Deltaproteobacteria bacterium]|nr:ABC transporter permease [Deltaproteobacteria bacterium]